MESKTFDRLVVKLAAIGPRRDAVKAAAAAGVAAAAHRLGASGSAGKKRKKRCHKIGETCGGKKKCCNKSGLVECQEFPAGECDAISGFHCCGMEGARCDPKFGEPTGGGPDTFGNCSCCAPLFCGKQLNGDFRCQSEDT